MDNQNMYLENTYQMQTLIRNRETLKSVDFKKTKEMTFNSCELK